MKFEPGEREYLNEMRSLTTDVHGREHFVGLTVEESEEYFGYTRPGGLDWRPSEDWQTHDARRDRYLELHDKMEQARFQVLGGEHVARTMNPTRN